MIDPIDNEESDEDDFKVVPEAIKEKILSFISEKLKPAILDHLKKKCQNFKFQGIAVEHISYEYLCSYRGSLKPAFLKKHQIDLHLMERYSFWPSKEYLNIAGKKLVGAAIRLSNRIDKPEYADALKEIVRNFFTPEELLDPKTTIVPYYFR